MHNGDSNQLSKAAFPPWMQTLRAAVDAELKDDDLQGIVRAFVDKAKQGDEKAARFVLEYLMGGKLAPQNVTIHNHYEANGTAPKQTIVVDSTESRIHTYLEASGSAKPAIIAADLGLPVDAVKEALKSEWFVNEGGAWRIAKASDRKSRY